MKVGRWGNSLAVRLPASVVQALAFKKDDDITVTIAGERLFPVERDRSREEAFARLAESDWTLTPGFRSDREETNGR